ncbi:MAG: beta-lactamase family protein [Hyphomonadaceae bacterium]|nr:beta-lactamase family protein [Hyphomonadaceae bacterium]
MTALLLSFATTAVAMAQDLFPLQSHPEATAWPTKAWDTGAMPAGTDAEVEALVAEVMGRDKTDLMGETRAVVIIHDGKLVFEAYRDGFGPETKQVSWSMAKSITQALVGRAVQLGLIADIDAAMPTPFEDSDPRSAITWRQWLNMTDGLDYKEINAPSFAENDVVHMMYGRGKYDVLTYVREELPLIHEPGTQWNYSTAGFHLVSWALADRVRRSSPRPRPHPICTEHMQLPSQEYLQEQRELCDSYTGRVAWANFGLQRVKKRFHAPIGYDRRISNYFVEVQLGLIGMDVQPEFDPAGTFLGGSLVWASARDFAKFGYLYLRDGVWEDERLLPEGWVDFARTKTPADNANIYGAGWWITAYGEDRSHAQNAKTPPWDAFHAGGHEGQTIWVVPSRDLVIVRLGLMSNAGENWEALYEWNQQIARAFPEVGAE